MLLTFKRCVFPFNCTCFSEGMGDQSSDKLVLGGPEQEDDVSREGIPVLGQEARCVVDHLVAEEEEEDEDVW